MRPRLLVLVFLVAFGFAGDASAAWTRPVAGPIVGRFLVTGDPFAAGQRRGVDLAAAPGARVAAPCAGVVAFAGRVPRFGWGVSIRCGRLTATVLGLGSVLVGSTVQRGDAIGVAGARGRVRLGARVTRLRFGYRDPLRLLAGARRPSVGPQGARRRDSPAPGAPPAPPPVSLPPGVAPMAWPAPAASPVWRPPAVVAHAAPRPSGAPALAWIGVALVACGLPGGAIAWRVRRLRAPLARSRLPRPR